MKILIKIIFTIALATLSFSALAADWAIAQKSEITTPSPGLKQGDQTAVTNSIQSINGIVLEGAADDLIEVNRTSTQSALITATTSFTMLQGATAVADSKQAINYIYAKDIGRTEGVVQSVTMTGVSQYNQTATGGNNVQGGSVMQSSTLGKIINVSQIHTASNNIRLEQNMTSGNNNFQVLNLLDGTANPNTSVGLFNQNLTSNGSNTVFLQSAQSTGNVQAGNMVDALSSIDGAVQAQRIEADSSLIDFDQIVTANNNIQAGNMARTDGMASNITNMEQIFFGSTMENDFNQDSGANTLIQSGNLIDVGTGGIDGRTTANGNNQTFEASSSVNMTQLGGGQNNLQALNATVDSTGGTLASTVKQRLMVTGAFTLAQNAVTASGQFGNFVGLKY